MEPLKVLVSGVTGRQGGAVARALLARGHEVKGVTRDRESAAARALDPLGARLVEADLTDADALTRVAEGCDAVFVVTTPFEAGTDAEIEQGVNLVGAARAAGVRHVVFSSVAGADQDSGIPRFESKRRIEEYLLAGDVPWTIVAPVYFMENLLHPRTLGGLREGRLAVGLPAERPLQMIAVEDVGNFVARVFDNAEAFLGRRIELASDVHTGAQTAAILAEVIGHPVRYLQLPLDVLRTRGADVAAMFDWLDRVGYHADIDALRRDAPDIGWHTLSEWARARDWERLMAGV